MTSLERAVGAPLPAQPRLPRALRLPGGAFLLAAALLAAAIPAAQAHIKWFAPFDVPSAPRPLLDFLTWNGATAVQLLVGMAAILLAACMLERSRLGAILTRLLDGVSAPLRGREIALLRGSYAVFFSCLFVIGDVILTPELKTSLPAIAWTQAGIVATMFWRRLLPIGAGAIFALYAYAVTQYGVFHMLDYPIFLGLALGLALHSAGVKTVFGLRPLDVVRWGTAITLMWAAGEKWAYPLWTYPILAQHPNICAGFSDPFYMMSAGFVEFSLGFAMIWSPAVRRVGAALLLFLFTSAVVPFGKVDAIGHLMIIAALLCVFVDPAPSRPKPPLLGVAAYLLAWILELSAYWGFHALIFGTAVWR